MAQIVDIAVPAISGVLSAALVLRYGFLGFAAGVFAVWAFGIARIELLYLLDPQRDVAMLDAAWVAILGWIVGVMWCSPFLAGRLAWRWWRRRQMTNHEGGA